MGKFHCHAQRLQNTNNTKYLHVLVAQPINFAAWLIVDIHFSLAMVIKCNGCKNALSVIIIIKNKILQRHQAFKYTNICDMLNVAAEHYFPGFFWMQKRIIWPTLDIFGFVCIFQKWPPSTTCHIAYAEMKDKFNSTLPYLLEGKGIRKLSRS